jgi:hypothetical protein
LPELSYRRLDVRGSTGPHNLGVLEVCHDTRVGESLEDRDNVILIELQGEEVLVILNVDFATAERICVALPRIFGAPRPGQLGVVTCTRSLHPPDSKR